VLCELGPGGGATWEGNNTTPTEASDTRPSGPVPKALKGNPLVLRAVGNWEAALSEEDLFSPKSTDDLLLAAFPFKREKVWAETVAAIIDPPRGEDPPYDWLHYHRYELHQLMRHAHRLGLTFVVERLEEEREDVSAQLAYVVALRHGAAPEVLERAAANR
jgi:hypothetical protein